MLKNFSKSRMLILGDVMIDEYIIGKTVELSYEAPIPVVEINQIELKMGGAGTIIEASRELGANVYAVAIVGNDEYGLWLKKYLKKLGLSTSNVIIDTSIKTVTRTRLLANNHYVARFDRPSIILKNLLEKKIIHKIRKLIPMVDCVVISDYGKGMITKKMMEEVKINCIKNKKNIIVSPSANFLQYADSSFIYRITIRSAAKLLGLSMDEIVHYDTTEICKMLEAHLRSKRIILTRGDLGLTAYENGQAIDIASTYHKARDVTSVGDILISAFAASYSSGMTFTESCRVGNVAAGIAVEKIGIKHVQVDELRQSLSEFNEFEK